MKPEGIGQAHQRIADDRLVHRKQMQKRHFENLHQNNQHDIHGKADPEAQTVDPSAPLLVARSVILACEGHCRLRKGIEQAEGNRIEIPGRRHTRNAVRAEAVHSALDHDVGKRKDSPLDTGRHADPEYRERIILPKTQLLQIQSEFIRFPEQKQQDQAAAQTVGKNGRKRDTDHMQMQHSHKKQIQQDIQNACRNERIERADAVTAAAQHRRAVIIQKNDRHACKINPQIQHCQPHDIIRCPHQAQNRTGQQNAGCRQKDAQHEGQRNHRVNRIADPLPVPRADLGRNQNSRTDGQSDKDAHQKIDHRSIAAHGRHCLCTGEPTHHGQVRRVEHLLQHTAGSQRQCEPDDLSGQRPVGHIYFIALIC